MEDPRVTRVDELDAWVIAYTAFGPRGPAVALAVTHDFLSVDRLGVVCPPEDKNASLLPRRVNGEFVLFHRPARRSAAGPTSGSPARRTCAAGGRRSRCSGRPGGWWDSARIGVGPPPLETAEGWLVVYHGVRQTVAGELYRVGLALLDLDDPGRVFKRCDEWVLGPDRAVRADR